MTTLQKTVVSAALVVAVGTGIFQAHENSKLRKENQALQGHPALLSEQLRQLKLERDEALNRLNSAKSEIASLKSDERLEELVKLRGQIGTLQKQLALNETRNNAPFSKIAKMMHDPAAREFNRQTMLKGIKSRYAALFEELQLKPEQIEEFAQLFSGLYLKYGEIAASFSDGNHDMAEIERASAAAKQEFGKQIKPLLGEAGFARFVEFSSEVPARTTVQLINDQLGGSPLNADQTSRLFQVVKAEPFELTHGIEGDMNQAFFGSPQEIENYLQQLDESNRRILQKAGEFLNKDQLSALNTVLVNGVNARKAQAAMFGK